MKKLVVFILIFLSFVLQSVGEIQEFRFSQIGIDRGLSHTTVNGISQDASGYIWIATPDGLNRYDGFKFTDFLTDSLDHNVKSVMSDKKGNLFAITSHTLSSYSSTSESFENHTFPHSGSLTTLLPVSADRIAVGSTSGFYYFDIRNHTFSLAPGTAGKNITSTALFDGNVVIGTAKGEVREVAGKQPFSFVLPDHPEVNVLLQDNNSLLIGTEGKGLFRYTPASRRLESVGGGSGINFVRSLLIDSRQRLWVGTFTGLYILDADRKNMVFHDDATASGGALSHSSVRRMFADRQGGVWLGTYYGGLNYYHPQLNQFTTLSKHNSGSLSISGNVAGPMAEDVKGNIWIGTNDGALNIYDPRTREFRKYTRREGLGSDDIKAIYIDEPRRRAYIGTHIGGLSVMDLSSGAITAHRNIAQSVYDILPALDGSKLWLAVLDGIYLLDTNSFESRRVSAPGLPRLTTSLMRDSERRIWISGEDGMAVYGEENGRLKFEKNLPHSSDHVNEVYESPSTGKFWIATHRGLLSYDPATGKSFHYGIKEGLPGDIVYSILEDPKSNIWVATNRGLACVEPASGKIMVYSNRDGISSSQFTDRSSLKARNGLMYFGGISGVTYFNPSVLEKNTFASTPIIEGVRLFNKTVTPGDATGILKDGISKTGRIVFNSSQTNFTIDFTVCDYVSKGKNTFQYMLDGLDRDWITAPPGVRSVSYSNLPAGKYTFRLRAANNDGVWSDREASIGIEILPPWYKTWWAISLMVLLALAAGFFAIRYVWKRKSLEKIQKARQEVNEMKVRFFVNMSHELRTPLTLMLLPVNELIASKPDQKTLQKLTTVRNNTLRISHIVNQLLDYRRAEMGMFRLGVSEHDINALFSDILESYRSLADKKHIRFHFNSTVSDPKVYVDANYLELIVNNLVTNAFKYTPDGGDITVDLSVENGRMRFSVRDTGCGIPADKIGTIFTRFFQVNDSVGGYGIGLSLVKRLVELHHGSITVESVLGKGSCFTVILPVASEAYHASEIAANVERKESRKEDISFLLPLDDEVKVDDGQENDYDGRKTVLVVDDNAEILKYLSSSLSAKFRVLTAANGTKAIEELQSDPVDLVISDVMMPDMDGVQLCRAIKRNLRTSHIPVMLLSAKSAIADRLEGLKVGADDYIAKPFQMEELLAKVRNLIHTRESIIRHYSQDPSSAIEPSKVAQNPLDEEFLDKAIKIMEEHLDDSEFTTDEFARQMCMSRSNLHLKMKALTGEATNDFIRRIRMRKASELLKTRRYTVAEVSVMVGYNTPSYFATAFKNYFGFSPSSLLSKD